MLTLTCPHCGAACRAALSTPETLRCGSCRYEGPPSAEGAERLRVAAAALSEIGEDDRQLRGLSRRVLASGFFRTAFLVALALLLGAPLVVLAVVFVGMVSDGAVSFTLSMLAVPVLFVLLVGAISVRLFLARTSALEDACAARPPAAPGAPAGCQLCGGPLSDGAVVVRCGYCKTDNLISPAAMRRVTERQDAASDVMSLMIEQRLRAVKRMTIGVALALFMAAILAPMVFLSTCLLTATAVDGRELDLDESQLITTVDHEGKRCIGELDHWMGSSRIGFGGRAENGFIPWREGVNESEYSFRSPTSLAGQRVRVFQSGVEGTVVRLYSRPGDANYAILRTDTGEEVETRIAGLCLVP